MKKWLGCFVMLIGCSVGSMAQFEKSLLWKVSKPSGELEGYLYGTIHISDPRVTSWDETFHAAFSQCDLLLGELDMDVLASMDVDLMGALFMQDTLLRDLYTPEEWSVLNDSLRLYFPDSLSFAFMEMMYPMMVETSISQMRNSQMSFKDLDSNRLERDFTDRSMVPDVLLQDMARERNLMVMGIESVEDQLQLFRMGGAKEQGKSLYRTVVGYTEDEEKNEKWNESLLLEKYIEQDIQFFLSLINEESMGASMYYYFFEKRNLVMFHSFVDSFSYAVPFCAVGAGHLAGKDGILYLLEQRGYLVEPVYFRFTE